MTPIRRAAAGLAAVALAALVPLSSASAAPATTLPVVPCRMTPRIITVYDHDQQVEFTVDSDFPYWQVGFDRSLNPVGPHLRPGDNDVYQSLSAGSLSGSAAGLIQAQVTLYDAANTAAATCDSSLRLLQGTAVSLAVKTVSGGRREFSGVLKRIDFDNVDTSYAPWSDHNQPWQAFGGGPVQIQYQAANGSWVTASRTKSGAGGRFQITKKLGKHRWRAYYAGTAGAGARASQTVVR